MTNPRVPPAFNQWAELEAGKILDALEAYDGPGHLLMLQGAIAHSLCRAYEMGRDGKVTDDHAD
jgi:hypothetical protein